MINGTLKQFKEFLAYGFETGLLYDGVVYMTNGWFLEEEKKVYLCVENLSDLTTPSPIWEAKSDTGEENAAKFLTAKIFQGKSFLEIQDNVVWDDDLLEPEPYLTEVLKKWRR